MCVVSVGKDYAGFVAVGGGAFRCQRKVIGVLRKKKKNIKAPPVWACWRCAALPQSAVVTADKAENSPRCDRGYWEGTRDMGG